jgi:hypothetical protein
MSPAVVELWGLVNALRPHTVKSEDLSGLHGATIPVSTKGTTRRDENIDGP